MKPYTVHVVLDPTFGKQVLDLPNGEPVMASLANTPVVQQLWAERPAESHQTGLTIFDAWTNATPEELLLNNLDTIDEHHGVYSADPPYGRVHVYGTTMSPELVAAFHALGFTSLTPTESGFIAGKPERNHEVR